MIVCVSENVRDLAGGDRVTHQHHEQLELRRRCPPQHRRRRERRIPIQGTFASFFKIHLRDDSHSSSSGFKDILMDRI